MALRTPMRPSATPMLRWKLLRPAVHRPFSSCKALWHSSSANDSPLVETSVVGSFLFRLDADGKPRVALFRRSGQVKTYKHKYAPVSGKVEPHEDASFPLAAALRELREETGLTVSSSPSSSVRLLCAGAPYSFDDASAAVRRRWTIHPFALAWQAERPDEPLTLDWENEGYEWFAPDAIDDEACTPRLRESLRRVWPEAPLDRVDALVWHCLAEMEEEQAADARIVVGVAVLTWLQVLREMVPGKTGGGGGGGGGGGADEWWRLARLAAWHVWNYRNGRAEVSSDLLGRLVLALDRLEPLVSEARKHHGEGGLLPADFGEKAAKMIMDGDEKAVQQESEQEESVEQRADRYFADLWTLSS